jgi:hypothetical protein
MSVSVLAAGRNNCQYRYIFVVHNEYRKGARSFSSITAAGAATNLRGDGETMESG